MERGRGQQKPNQRGGGKFSDRGPPVKGKGLTNKPRAAKDAKYGGWGSAGGGRGQPPMASRRLRCRWHRLVVQAGCPSLKASEASSPWGCCTFTRGRCPLGCWAVVSPVLPCLTPPSHAVAWRDAVPRCHSERRLWRVQAPGQAEQRGVRVRHVWLQGRERWVGCRCNSPSGRSACFAHVNGGERGGAQRLLHRNNTQAAPSPRTCTRTRRGGGQQRGRVCWGQGGQERGGEEAGPGGGEEGAHEAAGEGGARHAEGQAVILPGVVLTFISCLWGCKGESGGASWNRCRTLCRWGRSSSPRRLRTRLRCPAAPGASSTTPAAGGGSHCINSSCCRCHRRSSSTPTASTCPRQWCSTSSTSRSTVVRAVRYLPSPPAAAHHPVHMR